MAISYPVAEPYARLVPELLTGAAVPWTPVPRAAADSVAGRVLVGVVDLVAAGFPRDEVAAWSGSRPHPRRRRRRVPGAPDVISRAADGRRRRSVDRSAGPLRPRSRPGAARGLGDDDQPDWRVGRLERDVEQTARLSAFVAELVAAASTAGRVQLG